jgi:hypothetical protein
MPFRKFALMAEQVEPLREAFGKVCEALGLSFSPEDPATDLVAIKILDVAATGELDPDRICDTVLSQLRSG